MTWLGRLSRLNNRCLSRFSDQVLIQINGTDYSGIHEREWIDTEAGPIERHVIYLDKSLQSEIPNNSPCIFNGENYRVRLPKLEDGLLVMELKSA